MRDDSSTPRRDAFHPPARSLLRFWPLVLVLIVPLTCLAVASLSAWYVPFYLLLIGLLVLAPDRARTSASKVGSMTAAGSLAAQAADITATSLLEQTGEPAAANATAIESAAQGTTTKSKRGRPRTRARPKFVPDPSHATWIRVGPGKFIRVETPPEPEAESEMPAGELEATTGHGMAAVLDAAEPLSAESSPPLELRASDDRDVVPSHEPAAEEARLASNPASLPPAFESTFSQGEDGPPVETVSESSQPGEIPEQLEEPPRQSEESAVEADDAIAAPEEAAADASAGSSDLSFEGIRTLVTDSWEALAQPQSALELGPGSEPRDEAGAIAGQTDPAFEDEPRTTCAADDPVRAESASGLPADASEAITYHIEIRTEELPDQGDRLTAFEPAGPAPAASAASASDPEEAEPAPLPARGSRPVAVAAPPAPGRTEARGPLRQRDNPRWAPQRTASLSLFRAHFPLPRGPPRMQAASGLRPLGGVGLQVVCKLQTAQPSVSEPFSKSPNRLVLPRM